MDFWLANTVQTIVACSAFVASLAIILRSPGAKARAEVNKIRKLKELDLIDEYSQSSTVRQKLVYLEERTMDQHERLTRVADENDFLRRLLEEKKGGGVA
ncbi:MAG: hypothetical protein ACLFNQ_12485 [Spirochaetaceae bacterium]